MSPRAWMRYWIAGWVAGPAVFGYGVVTGDWTLIILGAVIFVLAVVMTRFWRQRERDQQGREAD